jgi:flagellar biosynthesis component FlhA
MSDTALSGLRNQLNGSPDAAIDERLLNELRRAVRPGQQRGHPPVIVVPTDLRRPLRTLLTHHLPQIQVLSLDETAGEGSIDIFATVGKPREAAISAA